MALTATICKAAVDINDVRRHYYQQHRLTIAKHPSETDERMMLRLLAFTLFAHESLQFTRGLSNDDEPDLWQKSLSGEIELWIELGQPSDKRLRRACGLARRVVVLSYGGRVSTQWWQEHGDAFAKQGKLSVIEIASTDSKALAEMAERNMQLQITLDEDSAWVSNADSNLEIATTWLCGSPSPD